MKICDLLLEHKKIYFSTLGGLAGLKELNVRQASKAMDQLRGVEEHYNALLKLKASHGQDKTSKLLKSLERVVGKIHAQEEDVNGPEGLNIVISKLNAVLQSISKAGEVHLFDSCNECGGNVKPPTMLECGHMFCTNCGTEAVQKAQEKGKIAKCLIPYCYYIINEEELGRLYPFRGKTSPPAPMTRVRSRSY